MATQVVPQPRVNSSLAANIGFWALQISLALFLGFAGSKKLTGDPQMIQLFGIIGLGQWFRYLTGGLEVLGAIGLLVPRLTAYAAALLAVVMFGAVATHVFILGNSPIIPLTLALVVTLVAWYRGLHAR